MQEIESRLDQMRLTGNEPTLSPHSPSAEIVRRPPAADPAEMIAPVSVAPKNGVIAVDPARHPHVKAEEVRIFIHWLLGAAGQDAIASFRIGSRQVFHPMQDSSALSAD